MLRAFDTYRIDVRAFIMTLTFTRNVVMVFSVVSLCVAVIGCSSSGDGMNAITSMTLELKGGLAQSPEPPVYADSNQDTLTSLLTGGNVFPPLSAALPQDLVGPDAGVTQPDLNPAYVRSVSSDGAGGFRVTYVIDGEQFPVHLEADQAVESLGTTYFQRVTEDNYSFLWSWTENNGSSELNYLDLSGWTFGTSEDGELTRSYAGYLTYGVRSMPENLPLGSATYKGRMQAELWNANSPDYYTQRQIQGALSLEVNLDDRQISGRIDELRMTPPDSTFSGVYEPWGNGSSIDITGTTLEQARFTADWAGNGPMDAAPDETIGGFTGTILGEFYGPAAEEIGGVLSGRRAATDTTPEQFIIGGLGASQTGQ